MSWHSFIDFSGEIGLGEYWGLRDPFSFLHGLLAISQSYPPHHSLHIPSIPCLLIRMLLCLCSKSQPIINCTASRILLSWGALLQGFTTSLFLTLYLGSGSLETASEIGILVHVICWGRALGGLKGTEWITRWLSWNMISD